MKTLDWSQCPAVERSPRKVSGEWLFRDTRVPVKALFENLEDGATVDDFVAWFPGVRRDQAVAILAFAEQTLFGLDAGSRPAEGRQGQIYFRSVMEVPTGAWPSASCLAINGSQIPRASRRRMD